MAKIGRNDPCPCGSGKKYKKCCEDKEPGLLVAEDRSRVQGPQMQLVIDTKDGPFVRNVSTALPRRLQHEQGKEAESATHAAAAMWGLADFVFEPAHRRRNAGVRELGDGVLVLGELGVVLQVKSREPLVTTSNVSVDGFTRQLRRRSLRGPGLSASFAGSQPNSPISAGGAFVWTGTRWNGLWR
jgi:SEC-C motif